MNDNKNNNKSKTHVEIPDFDRLSQEIGKTINNALESAFDEAKDIRQRVKTRTSQERPRQTNQNRRYTYSNRYAKRAFRHQPIGHVAGILLTVFGLIGIIGFGIPAFVLALSGVGSKVSTVFIGIVFMALLAKSEGDRLRKRHKRYEKYVRIINNRTSCSIKELADHTSATEKFVYRDLKKMIKLGIFPDGNFTKNKTVLILTRDKYDQYLNQQANLESEMKAKKAKDDKAYSQAKIEIQDNWPSIEKAGKIYIQEITGLKTALSDKNLVEEVHKTEILTIKILEYAKKKDKDPNDVRRLMNYYLPETIKLLKTYKELDSQPVQGVNITSAKTDIASAILSINDAFEQLFDSLFEEDALNVSADVSVLNTVFTQNGLKDENPIKN